MTRTTAAVTLWLLLLSCAAGAEDPFAAGVRPTDPLSPAAEQKTFKVPPGFEVQLVAAEPQIAKPLNMAFDERGRLWLTDTVEYPYAAPLDRKGRDSIKVLEDTDGDGRADRVTTFADGLNIPMGIYPYRGGAIAFSIPYIWHFKDNDGDGKADERIQLFGPFDHTRDVHGLNNAFRRGFDGWLYACHGFNNRSVVKGADGHTVTMPSGNTYRVRLDGSRIEQFTWGQVNPFGMAMDPLGNLFTADCHSKPVYQLLRGGHYPTFGPPDDPLGLVPPMMDHLHGSTAIGGVAFYAARNFPEQYRGNVFSGNVMTSRVNRNSLVYHGSTIRAKEEPDFVVAEDPWFRPVDIVQGPDGALYMADFYNKIIGHYEVPLPHPGRDRHRGRIWRIVYKGDDTTATPLARPKDLTKASTAELIAALDDDNLTTRNLAMNLLVDVTGAAAAPELAQAFDSSKSAKLRSQTLWAMARLGTLSDERLAAAAGDAAPMLRVHAMKVLSETPNWPAATREMALRGLKDADAFVRRAAADALARHPQYENVAPLLDALLDTPEPDNHLRHTIRMALREQMTARDGLARLAEARLAPRAASELADVALAVPTAAAGAYLARYAQQDVLPEMLARCAQHVARYAAPELLDSLAEAARAKLAGDAAAQWGLLSAIEVGLAERGAAASGPVRRWAERLVGTLFDEAGKKTISWVNTPLAGAARKDDPWVRQQRPSADGDQGSIFFCSLPRGEQLTGTLRSGAFAAPPKLSFFVAGHVGYPGRPVVARNFIRLRQAGSDAVLAESTPPRNDVAQRIEWSLEKFAGQSAYVEIVDGDEGDAYAWLAVGRFSLAALSPNDDSQRLEQAAAMVGRLRLDSLRPKLTAQMLSDATDAATRVAAARALVALTPDTRAAALAAVLGEAALPDALRRKAASALAGRDEAALADTLGEAMRLVPARMQLAAAETLAADAVGARTLLRLVESGALSPHLLRRPTVGQRLSALKLSEVTQKAEELTAKLPPPSEALEKLIEQRRAGFARATPSLDKGAAAYAKHCAACHQLDGKGTVIGPQLDGIGNRGLERLLEDLLDPNRNVDPAFRSTTLALSSGKLVTGLVRRREGARLVLADGEGKEFSLAKDDVAEESRSQISLMPANVGEILTEQEFYDLMGFLVSKRAAPASSPGR